MLFRDLSSTNCNYSIGHLFCFFGASSCLQLEKEMATHSSTLAWKIPWTEEPGRLQSMGLQIVEHDWAISLVFSILQFHFDVSNHGFGFVSFPWNCFYTTQLLIFLYHLSVLSCLGNPMDSGACWAIVHGITRVGHDLVTKSLSILYICQPFLFLENLLLLYSLYFLHCIPLQFVF